MPPRVMRLAYLAMFVIGAGAIVYALAMAASGPAHDNRLERFASGEMSGLNFSLAGQPAPKGSFAGPDGQEMTLADFEGRTILVNFWATWCAPCEREMPHLGALQNSRGSEDFEVVAISIDEAADADYARERLGELSGNQLAFYHTPPENWEVVYGAGARGFPTTIVYGPDGREIARLAGEAPWSDRLALAFIDEVVER